MLFIALFFVYGLGMTQAQTDDVTGYETVTVSIPATGYDASKGPEMARVKFNRQFPLVITSDDGRKPEYVSNWTLMNGYPNVRDWQDYPYLSGDDMLGVAYDKTFMGTRSSDVNDYQPMTFDDGTGKRRRFTLTSAVPPTGSSKTPDKASYDQINREDAKAMLRTGFSFAQHDVDDASSVESIKSDYARLNTLWADNVGIGLKVMVEPNGNKNYVEAAEQSDEICWNIYQAATEAYPALDNTLAQWTGGTQPSTYTTTKATRRTFPNSDAAGETAFANSVRTAISNGNTDPMFYGCHGLGSYAQNLLMDLATNATYKDKVWVTGADEFWEYYNIYNNVVIENVSYNDNKLTFDVKVPTYKKNQFRELTLNVPGLTGAGKPTFSSESGKTVPTTGSYRDNGSDGFTMNIGLESRFTDYVNQLRALYRDDQMNEFVKRDLQYLVDQLWDNKDYVASLDALPAHHLTVKASLAGSAGPTLATIKTDTDGEKQYAVPRYIVSGGKLYETAKQAAQPFYKPTIQTSSTADGDVSVSYAEKDLSTLAGNIAPVAVSVVEGEDMEGAKVIGASFNSDYPVKIASGGLAGGVVSGGALTASTSLPRGSYKAIIGYGETWKAQGTFNYQVLVDGTQVHTFSNASATNNAITEFTTDEFTVEIANTPVTITTDNTNPNSRWIDYVVFVQTSSLDPVAPSITATASAGTAASVKVGTSITITATAAQNGGSSFTGTTIYQCSDATGTIVGEAKATSAAETVTYTFTPTEAGTYYFKATAADGTLGSNTTDVITLNVVADINEYTLVIVDKSGGEAMTTTVQSSALTVDPLPMAYRSPFAENYRYYLTAEDAQNNNTANALANTDAWTNATIYVGYDVKSTFSGDKKFTIVSRDRYMHMVWRVNQKEPANQFWLQNQDYDVSDIPSMASSDIVRNEGVTTSGYALMDNAFIWELGTDPYNITFKNKATGYYANPIGNSPANVGETSTNSYSILYWANSSNVADTSVGCCRIYYRGSASGTPLYVISRTSNGYDWIAGDTKNGNYNDGSKVYIQVSPTPVTINVLNSKKNVECQLEAYYNSTAKMQAHIPYSLLRAYTTGHALYYDDKAATKPVTMGTAPLDGSELSANGYNLYMTYNIVEAKWRTAVTTAVPTGSTTTKYIHSYEDGDENIHWYILRANTGDDKCIKADTEALPSSIYNVSKSNINNAAAGSSTLDERSYWAFVGTPYHLQLVNQYHGLYSYLGYGENPASNDRPQVYTANTTANTVWEVATYLYNKDFLFIRPQGSLNGVSKRLYINQAGQLSGNCDDGSKFDFYYVGQTAAPRVSQVHLEVDNGSPYVSETVTLTATATPGVSGTTDISYLAIEQETSTDVWEVVGTVYNGSNVTGATKDAETGVVTVTYSLTPTTEGTHKYRARAVIDGAEQLSTADASEGGDGNVISVNATERPFSVGSDNYTLVLVDKAGATLYTETNVPATRVSTTNSVSLRQGDPLSNDWRSPLVTRYYYYKTLAAAQNNTKAAEDLFDWSSTEVTPTVYVGYEVSDAIDLNGDQFSSLNDLMTGHVARGNGDNTMVRQASKFGKMYMLKFKTSEDYHLEDTHDKVDDVTASGSYVYPYTNGDGPIYLYNDAIYQDTKDNGASTRTRYPWFLVSLNGDPYHVYVTSWQSSHSKADKSENFYSYLRTYYVNSTIGVVTNNVTDDPATTDGSLPTEYMILRGNGTYGDYKLVTTGEVNGSRQTVTSFEQYWRTNPTAQTTVGKEAGTALDASDKTTLTSSPYNWHEYAAYVNAKPETGGDKTYEKVNHWFMTVKVGDGSFDLVESNIDGVLVLLDNHGWEVMRKPIVARDDPDYEAVKAELKKFDSPMVSQYKFYYTRSVDHKVYGYHKYDIVTNTGSKKPLAATTRVTTDSPVTSLADYPESMSGGALTDLYVTYDVKPEYANSYVGAATEEATQASSFLLQQGGNYAYTTGGGISTSATSDNTDAYKWKLKPNFNIDTEMGYKYDDGTGNDEKSQEALETQYYNEGRNGFDPYNLQLQNVSTTTYLTTNATTAALSSGVWTGDGTTANLQSLATRFTTTGYDSRVLSSTNATFMAVQDGNGNMRLMPRFDYGKVLNNFTTLAEQAADQTAGDVKHAQTTLITTPVTYHIIDNSGNDVFSDGISSTAADLAVPKEYRSPMVEEYFYHSTLEDAQNNRTTSTMTTVQPGATIYVSYKVKDDFSTKAWNIWNTDGLYMHAVSRNNQEGKSNLWWMSKQHQDRDSNLETTSLSTSNMPFLDNSFAWQFGTDPYNTTLFNKAAQRYVKQNDTSANNGRMDHLVTDAASATPYAILYYDNTQTNDNAILYDLTHNRYVRAYGNDKEWCSNSTNRETTGELVITQLPAISINIVDANKKVECTLEGFYNKNASWSTPFVPLYLERYAASNQAFYYDQACENAISGQVDDATVTANKAVYVSYTLDAAKWGTLDKTANTTIVMPSPTNDNKVEWYSMTSNNKTFAIDADNKLVQGSTGSGDTESEKKGQWALMGTPYSVKIVNRFAGSTNYLGIPAEINNDPNQLPATIHPEGTANVVDTWEVCENMGGSGRLLQIRPQRSFNGQSTYGYLGNDGNTNGLLGLSGVPNGNLQVKLTFQKETDAKVVTFKLYDRNKHAMSDADYGGIADVEIHGVSAGDQLADIFAQTHMERRYCEYKFYSDKEMKTEVTKASDNLNEEVYVKWDYTDDAPVFNEGVTDPRDYQYYMLGVWGFNEYNLMDVEGEGTTESPYTFKPNNTVGTPRDLKHQFALVGNPYGFKLYNRAADKDIKRNKDLEITFADKEADGTTDTEEITFDLPIVSGSAYTSTETHFRSTTTGRYLSVTGTNDNKLFSMTDNARGSTRFRYIIVPVRVFKEGAVSSTAEKDYRMYALEMNPSGTARTTDARITTNDLRATGNAIGNARDFNHAFCNYTYYQKYDWDTSVSDPVPDGGLFYYGGKDQTKRQFIATYTVDQEAFERLYYLDNSPLHNNAYSSKGAESTSNAGSYTTAFNTQLEEVKNNVTDVYRWRFTGDPYDLQIHNVNTDKQSEDYVLAVKTLTDAPNTEPTATDGTLALVTKDVKDGDSDTESYGQYSHWEIIQRSDGHYLFWNIKTGERYTYALTTKTDKLNKGILYVTVPPFENGSTTVLNINQVEWNLVDVFNHYNVTWHVMEKTGENTYTQVAAETKVVDEDVTLTIEDLPASVKRHFCNYEKMYSDAACTTETEITEHTVNAATDIYVPYTLDSGAPEFVTEAPTGTPTGTESYWYEIHFPDAGSYLYADETSINKDNHNINSIRTGEGATTYPHYRWALIGSPYDVKFYNMETKNFMTNDGTALSMGSTGTSFDLLDNTVDDEDIEGLGTIFDTATSTYITGNAGLLANQSGYTACEFSNVNGVVHIVFRLHYSDKTLRKYDSNNDGNLSDEPEGNAVNTLGNIDITTFQKLGKDLNEIFPQSWKRTFCNYTYYWKTGTGENSTISEIGTTQTEVTQEMIDAFNNDPNHQPIYVHVTYDFEGGQNPKWSTADKEYTGKHWYYLVNNHCPNGEQGKMVYRDSSPKLRVSTSLQQNRLYLNNFEWCVIGDPYGFKMLNRYDPDRRFDEYIRVTGDQDSHGDGLQLEQSSTNSQNIFEMMPGQYSYNFWIHPIYNQNVMDEYTSEMSYVGNNFNGSAAIIPNDQRSMTYLKTNSSANFRLEIQSDATLAEYVKYAGFVGGLNYDVAEQYQTAAADDSFTDEEKTAIRTLVDEPANIVQMTQGYYRIVPFTQEGGSEHKYIRGYLDENEKTGSGGMNRNLKVEAQSAAEYDAASIFWFEGTTSDGTENGYPRYFIKTQDLCLGGDGLVDVNAATNYKSRYEDLGAAITQLKISDTAASAYLSCTSNATEASTNQCFDEQAGQFKTRFYLQKVNNTNANEMPFKMKLGKGHNGRPLLEGCEAYGNLPYTYTSLYVPFDLQVAGGKDVSGNAVSADDCDMVPFVGIREHYYSQDTPSTDTYYEEGEYALVCQSINAHQKNPDWLNSNRYIPAGTPVIFRSVSGMTEVTYVVPTVAPSTANESLKITENMLEGTYIKVTDTDENIRIFGKESKVVNGTRCYTGRVGLFPRSSTATKLTNNKIYYRELTHDTVSQPGASNTKAVLFSFDESKGVKEEPEEPDEPEIIPTGINNVDATTEGDVIFDLQGRKVTRPTKRGVYIVNGRKVVIK